MSGSAKRGQARFWRSAGLRLATVYAALFALSALALVIFLWWATAGLLDRQVETAIRADAQGLLEQWQTGGINALRDTIAERLATDVDDDAIYLITDAEGTITAGNLARWPTVVTSDDISYDLVVRRAGRRSVARVRRFELSDGDRLLIGRDMNNRLPLRDLLSSALLWSLLLLIVLGTVGALVMQRLFGRMIASVSQTATAVAQGDLGHRVRVTGRGDEFDQVAVVINDMLDRIARLMDGVRQVSNSIAHDLRTPISRARARLEDAGRNADTASELRAAVDRAVVDLDEVAAISAALLRIAEIEAGSRRSAFAPLEVDTLLSGLVELYGAAAEERGQTLSLHAADGMVVNGDRDLIQQAIANLLDNAIKFSPSGSVVRVDAAGTSISGGGVVHMAVSDAGPGIPAEDLPRAADRFFRGEQARSTAGSGLGLALVDAVAQLHGGSLRLEDACPGLRAVLTLPRVPVAPEVA